MINLYTDLEVRVREFGRRLVHHGDGASAVEYALLVSFIALVIIVSVTLLGTNLRGKFSSVATPLG